MNDAENKQRDKKEEEAQMVQKIEKKALGELYLLGLGIATNSCDIDPSVLRELEQRGLIQLKGGGEKVAEGVPNRNGSYVLTESGRQGLTVVMIGGTFDVLHPGHIETLRQAKSLGDLLVVSVARDSTVERNRRKRSNHNEEQRAELVSSMRYVDAAVLGSEKNIMDTVVLLKPDIIALGYDQSHSVEGIEGEARKRGVNVRVVRLTSSVPSIKSSKILSEEGQRLLGEI